MNSRAEAPHQFFLKKIFSGQLIAQDPTDEPAGVLLERILKEGEMANIQKPQKKASFTKTVSDA